jgi:hemoglobin/transferrin/lactoferrin receptor protein
MKSSPLFIISTGILFTLCRIQAFGLNADSTGSKEITLEEVVISVNKTEESKKSVAQQVQLITRDEIISSQSQTTADLLSNAGNVFVQKSQLGGGSPVIRGFEASRILLVIDGVRMNNIIYRSGHLQNSITLDHHIMDRVEVLYGPSSTIYGSDALGGVIHLYSRNPILAPGDKKQEIQVGVFSRYGSSANEFTNHFDLNAGFKKVASLTSFTYTKFGDLTGGKNKNPFYETPYGERPHYVERIDGKDSLVMNDNVANQVQTAYSQYHLLQKIVFMPGERFSHGLNIQYSGSTDVPRYDRLTDPSASTGLRYAEWYYGPQNRLLIAYELKGYSTGGFFQKTHANVSYQHLEESRHNRSFGKDALAHRMEKVKVLGAEFDASHVVKSHSLHIGADFQTNDLVSTAWEENISTGENSPLDTRYPDGDNTMSSAAVYYSHTWHSSEKWIINDGIRLGYSWLHSTFADTTFFDFPYSEATQDLPVYSGSLGLIYNSSETSKLSFLLSTGFRVPNVDDLSKVFESGPGKLIIPNPDLKPEQTVNMELGFSKVLSKKLLMENTVYYTRFLDVIVSDTYTYNGMDSIFYNGEMSGIYASQNKGKAYVCGFSSDLQFQASQHWKLACALNYTYGRILGDSVMPLDHIPPFSLRFQCSYTKNRLSADFLVHYNGWKRIEDYYLNGEDNEQYATPDGMPAWLTLNLRLSYRANSWLTVDGGLENILDTQYRTFSSGMNGSGRNLYISARVKI